MVQLFCEVYLNAGTKREKESHLGPQGNEGNGGPNLPYGGGNYRFFRETTHQSGFISKDPNPATLARLLSPLSIVSQFD